MSINEVVISSGHGKHVRGASGYIDEVDEARLVVEQVATALRARGVETTTYHDDVSTSQNENLNRIVDFHNSKARDLDISVHFNAYETTSKPMGAEVLYVSSTGSEHADDVVDAICGASGLVNRGPKMRSDLFFLNNTEAPAILIETCFVDSQADVDIYRAKFEAICDAIAGAISGEEEIVPPPRPPAPEADDDIMAIAERSEIARYAWNDRGVAPIGYIKGFALAWATVVRKFNADHPTALEMALSDKDDDEIDALTLYEADFDLLGMSNNCDGIDTLRHLFVLLMGLGMRESSGQHCCGRDQSASNVSADTCEAGLFQTSYDAHSCNDEFDQVMDDYDNGKYAGYLGAFEQGVTCSPADWACSGSASSEGFKFQSMCKNMPAFAVESCALVLRNRCRHYGPIIRLEAELRPEADWLLLDVQRYVAKEGGA